MENEVSSAAGGTTGNPIWADLMQHQNKSFQGVPKTRSAQCAREHTGCHRHTPRPAAGKSQHDVKSRDSIWTVGVLEK